VDVYGQEIYTGGEAFHIIPLVTSAPPKSQIANGYSTPYFRAAAVYISEPSGRVEVFFNGSVV
jgi:hypothetical protein